MRVLIDIKHPNDLWVLLEFVRSLPEVHITLPADDKQISQRFEEITSGKISGDKQLSRKEALSIINKGCEMSSFGDPLEFQRQQRQDRNLMR